MTISEYFFVGLLILYAITNVLATGYSPIQELIKDLINNKKDK